MNTSETAPDAGLQKRVTRKYVHEAPTYRRDGPYFRIAGETIADMAGSCQGLRVLDVPVGTGRIMPFLMRGGARPSSYHGVDIATGMLRRSAEVAAELGIQSYGPTKGDLWNLPFPDNSFDLVLVLRLFHLFPVNTYSKALAEVYRVLRPGGVVIAEMRNRYRGCILGYVRQWLDKRNPKELDHFYIRPWELRRTFEPLRIKELRGYWFDGFKFLINFSGDGPLRELAGRAYRLVNSRLGTLTTRYLASELVIKAVKE